MTMTAPAKAPDENVETLLTRDELRAEKLLSRRPTWASLVLFGLVILTVVGMWTLPQRELVGASALVLMIVLLFMKVPLAVSLGVPALLGIMAIAGPRAVESVLVSVPTSAVTNWSLTVLPMFILMGMLLGSSGITGYVYTAARLWTTWLPGGLAIGTNVAGAGLASISGSTMGISYALGRVGIPEMLRRGYHPKLAIGSVIMAGLPGQVIPPSTFLIVVAGLTGAAVGPQLISGIIPGLTMVALVCALILAYALIFPKFAGRTPEQRAANEKVDGGTVTWKARFASLINVWPLLVVFIGVFGAMFSGLLTATEAGAMGAFLAVLLTLVFRRKDKPWRSIMEGTADTVVSVGSIFFMLVGAHMLGQMIAITRIGTFFSEFILSMGLDRVQFLLVVMVVYLILGMAMDPLAILLLTIPVLLPTFGELGIDPLWFGVFAVIMGELAILSPPVGVLTFVMHKILQDKKINLGHKVTLNDVFISVMMFFPAILALVVLMIFIPEIVTWLPSLMQ
ncbi:TRAP transporter large permease [Microbacterium sp.]|uniref:TRAP transporter large permease n=1 Tax=Microbacterium sp. TaxID=51671 RepID=UPI0027369E58|nr:TRAP transporter large permease [Microbacterium sp.]MDP3950270.1 TRAP transporter large permease [Microbacterium sp.]